MFFHMFESRGPIIDLAVISVQIAKRGQRLAGQKSWTYQGSALPPDVSRWLCPAVDVPFRSWAMPLYGLWPNEFRRAPPKPEASPRTDLAAVGVAKPPPRGQFRRQAEPSAIPVSSIRQIYSRQPRSERSFDDRSSVQYPLLF